MRNEPNLPPELAAIETQLRGLSLPAARFNREELFYQAGFAAARAKIVPTPRLFWPVTSGALAAAVIVLAVTIARTPTTVETVVEVKEPAIDRSIRQPEQFVDRPLPMYRHRAETAPLLALRERALRGEFPESTIAGSPTTTPVPTTARELMQELLPQADRIDTTSPTTTPAWPWQGIFGSDTI